MPNAARYRSNAAECERLAKKCADAASREGFERMAREWLTMAEEHERRFGRGLRKSSPADDSSVTE